MPVFRISTILIVTVILAGVSGMSQLVAEEPDRPFIARPSTSFAASNFTKPTTSSNSSAPNPPKSPEQLQHVRNALSATPVPIAARNNAASHQSIQQFAQPVQRDYSGHNNFSPVQQVSAIEPTQSLSKTADTAEPIRATESMREPELTGTKENAGIDRVTGISLKNGNAGISNETNDEIINKVQDEIRNEIQDEIRQEIKNSGKQNNKSTDNSSEQLLDKPIGFGKAESDHKLINRPKIANAITPLIPVLGSLLIVIGVFFILVLFLKKVSPKGNRLLPKEAFEDLGRAILTQKIQLHLLRLGNRLLLVSITPDGVSPITEITDPDEVVPLLGLCRQLDSHSSTEFFRKTLNSFSTGGVSGGYFGTDVSPNINQNINQNNNQNSLIGNNNRKTSSRNSKSKQTPFVDFYSEPDESLAEILAKGGQHG